MPCNCGRRSPGYGGGVFSPVMDNPTHHFHQWVARKLKAAQSESVDTAELTIKAAAR